MSNGSVAAQETYGLLAKERIIAKPGFNRWLVPPAALAIHLCIGMAYGFSVFWIPLEHAIGINEPVACAAVAAGAGGCAGVDLAIGAAALGGAPHAAGRAYPRHGIGVDLAR